MCTSGSVAIRHIIIFNEKLPEIAFAIVKAVEVTGGAVVRTASPALETLAS